MEDVLIKQINKYMNTYMYDNSFFLIERLLAEKINEEIIYLAGTCYFRFNKIEEAIYILEKGKSIDNQYLLSLAYYKLKDYNNTESILIELLFSTDKHLKINIQKYEANAYYILGCICRETNRINQAIMYFNECLHLDSYFWKSFEALSELGDTLMADAVFHNITKSKYIEGEADTHKLLAQIGQSYQNLCHYRCDEAIDGYSKLQKNQYNTYYIQVKVGKAYFEMNEYEKAYNIFRKLFFENDKLIRFIGLDIYSIVLYHLKKETELSFLAQQVSEKYLNNPQTWVILGNSCSLQKDHETAIKMFKKAIELDCSYTYGYTLCGHEYLSNEDFDNASDSYRKALQLDSRHYNAWFGLGSIYYKQENFSLAESHYRSAIKINPQCSLLYCYLSMTVNRYEDAINVLKQAESYTKTNPQIYFQLASIYYNLKEYKQAMELLEKVKTLIPKEASVHFLMGKTYKKMGEIKNAIKYFNNALYFNPKDANQIKMVLDRLTDPETEDDEHL